MKKILSAFLFTFIATGTSFAQTKTLKSGKIKVQSDKKNIDTPCEEFSSSIDLSAKTVSFEVPVINFFFKSKGQKKHWDKKVMEAPTFPVATYTGTIESNEDLTKDGTYEVTVKGKIKIKGIEKEFSASGTIKNEGGKITVNSTFTINRDTFGVTGMYANMTDKDIKVILEAVY